MKTTNLTQSLIVEEFTLPSTMSSITTGSDIQLATLSHSSNQYLVLGVSVYIFGQMRTLNQFKELAFTTGGQLHGVGAYTTFSSNYNSIPAYAMLIKK